MASAPGGSSNSSVSIPKLAPVRCSSSVRPPTAATNIPSARATRGATPVVDNSSAAPATAAQIAVFNFISMPESCQARSCGTPSAQPSTTATPPASG